MVAGRLQEKNGFYYIVLSYTDSAGKRRQPWIGTGLPVKGNKKRAEKMLADTRKDFTIPKGQVSELSPDMAFSDYMRYWLKMMRTAVTETTYSSYCFNVEKHIIPYFEPLGVTLAGLQPRQIQSFYLHEAETLKNTSILRFHANLHKALKYAVRIDLITSNPVDKDHDGGKQEQIDPFVVCTLDAARLDARCFFRGGFHGFAAPSFSKNACRRRMQRDGDTP